MDEQHTKPGPPPLNAGPPPLKRHRSKLPWILGGVSAAIAALIVGLVALAGFIDEKWGDLPEPPDETGFERYTESVPDEDNAYLHYVHAANATDLDESYFDRYYDESHDDALTSTLLEDLRADYREPLESYEAALAAQHSLAPRDVPLERYPVPDWEHTGDFDDLMFLCIGQRFHQGEHAAALDDALDYTYLGYRLMEARGPYVVYQEGVYLTETALETFANLVLESEVSNDEIVRFFNRLGGMYDGGDALRHTLVESYHAIFGTIGAMLEPDYGEVFGENNPFTQYFESQNRAAVYNVHPNRTRAQLLEVLRPLATSTHKSYADMPRERVPNWDEMKPRDMFAIMKPNGLGEFMSRYYLSDLDYTLETKCLHNTYVALAQAACALKMYHNDHGDLPVSLEPLVPDYLDRIPRDDFSGASIRYNANRGVIYSVGTDLRDNGGALAEDAEDEFDEIVLELSPLMPEPDAGDAPA